MAALAQVLVTRPSTQADGLINALVSANIAVEHIPMLETCALTSDKDVKFLKNTLATIAEADFGVFISTNAVRYTASFLANYNIEWPKKMPCIPIGAATAVALDDQGWYVDEAFKAKATGAQNTEALLAHSWASRLEGKKIALFRGVGGRELLAEGLQQCGAQLVIIETYQRYKPVYAVAELKKRLLSFLSVQAAGNEACRSQSSVIFASAETLENFASYIKAAGLQQKLLGLIAVVPSERVKKRAELVGFKSVKVAANASSTSLVEAVLEVMFA